jgi:hypothetical protein
MCRKKPCKLSIELPSCPVLVLCTAQVDYRWSGDANIFLAIELPAGGSATRMVPKVSDLAVRWVLLPGSNVGGVLHSTARVAVGGGCCPGSAARPPACRHPPTLAPTLPVLSTPQRNHPRHPQAAAARDPGLWRRHRGADEAAGCQVRPSLGGYGWMGLRIGWDGLDGS